MKTKTNTNDAKRKNQREKNKRVQADVETKTTGKEISAGEFEPIKRSEQDLTTNDQTETQTETQTENESQSEAGTNETPSTPLDQITATLGEYTEPAPEKKRRTRKPKATTPETETALVIPGSLFVTVVDQTAISALSFIDSLVSKKPMPHQALQMLALTESQKEQLAPLADAAIRKMNLGNDPVAVFFGSLAAIYLTNYMAVKVLLQRNEK